MCRATSRIFFRSSDVEVLFCEREVDVIAILVTKVEMMAHGKGNTVLATGRPNDN